MNLHTSSRIWTIGAVIAIVAIVAMGWFLGISPALTQAGLADTQRASVVAQNLVHEQEIVALKKQFTQLPDLRDQLAVLRSAVPIDGDLSTFLGQLHTLEQQNGVSLTSFTASSGELYTPVASKSKLMITTNPLVTPANFVAITVGVVVTGTQPQVLNFIESLQTGPRLYLVTKLDLVEETGVSKATISGLVYVLLDKPATPATAAASVKTATSP